MLDYCLVEPTCETICRPAVATVLRGCCYRTGYLNIFDYLRSWPADLSVSLRKERVRWMIAFCSTSAFCWLNKVV